jgi:hypothetical protein
MMTTRWIVGMALMLASGVFSPAAQASVGLREDPISDIDGRDVGETVDAEQLAAWRLQKIGARVRCDERKVGQPIVEVDLSGCRVSDETLRELLPLRHLRSLNLHGTDVTGKGLLTLRAIQSLRQLDLRETHLSQSDNLRLLQKAIPNLSIECGPQWGYVPPPAVVP